MKIIDIKFELLYNHDSLHIMLEKGQYKLIQPLLDKVGTIDPSKDYEVKIKPKSKKRSLDANGYFWKLIGELTNVLKKEYPTKTEDVYRNLVDDYGVYEIVPIKTTSLKTEKERWEGFGLGWLWYDMGECKNIDGYHTVKRYYGTSRYNSTEFSRILDALIEECKEQGIETETPAEIAKIKALWGDKNG